MPGRKPTTSDAERLHRAAIRLLRQLRREDDASGVSAPRLSVLSVLVFRGPQTLAALAEAEQVSRPTMTALIQSMEGEGWVTRAPNPDDARSAVISPSAAGRKTLMAGRDRRVGRLAQWMAAIPAEDRALLARAAAVMETLGAATPTSRRAGSSPRASPSGRRPRRARRPR